MRPGMEGDYVGQNDGKFYSFFSPKVWKPFESYLVLYLARVALRIYFFSVRAHHLQSLNPILDSDSFQRIEGVDSFAGTAPITVIVS